MDIQHDTGYRESFFSELWLNLTLLFYKREGELQHNHNKVMKD